PIFFRHLAPGPQDSDISQIALDGQVPRAYLNGLNLSELGNAMCTFASIFFEFNLHNATTWFYFSLLLAIALFFKFTRLLSVRNWDVLTLFLLVPGLLLLQEANSPGPSEPGPTLARGAADVTGKGTSWSD